MKKILALASISGLAIAAISTQVSAEDISHEVTLNAVVESMCSLAAAPTFEGRFTNATATSSTFGVNVIGSTAQVSSGKMNIGVITCTGGSVPVKLTRTTFLQNPSDATKTIAYTAYLIDDDFVNNSGSSGTSITAQAPATQTANVNMVSPSKVGIEINTQSTTGLKVGTYTGKLTLSVNPI